MRLAPGGSAIPLRALLRALRSRSEAPTRLREALAARFPGGRPTFHASGREAMRFVFEALARASGRGEVAIPAYGCFSIPASAVAAGLRVRLVDVDAQGRLAPEAIAALPFERLAAIVVGNLFGLPEPIASLCERARGRGVALIDDAAQALGAHDEAGAVGGRGDVGILSFGRGKPLSALGGGAAIWMDGAPCKAPVGPDLPACAPTTAALRGLAYDATRHPRILALLARIPALEIGVTHFDPEFARGPIGAADLALAAALEPELAGLNAERRGRALALAVRIDAVTPFRCLGERPGSVGVFPRLGLLAPDRAARDRALARLVSWGATAMYPTPMDAIRELAGARVDGAPCPGAKAFCDRLLTLPTHAGLREAEWPELIAGLGGSG